jgi:DNA polymerase-3 subunit delta
MSAALRQVAQLHKARLAVEEGASIGAALGAMVPFVHFSRKDQVEGALRLWSAARLLRAMAQLAQAALEVRRASAALAGVLAERALLAVAASAHARK